MTASATERAAEYHSDPGNQPTLSSSLCVPLIHRTPAHAWAMHPKLNPDYQPKTSPAMEFGIAVHQLLLRDDRVDVADYPDFRTADAKAWRDQVYANGRVPMLQHKWQAAQDMAAAVRDQMPGLNVDPTPFTHGEPEHTIRFEMGGVKCRAMLDWLSNDRLIIDDLKTTTDASPRFVERHLFNMGYDIRAAFYIRAVQTEHNVTPRFRWVFAESKPPYPVSIVELDDEALAAAFDKVDAAVALWGECWSSGVWPAYTTELVTVRLPAWQRDRWADVDVDETVPF